MESLTPSELYVLICSLDRQREHMLSDPADWENGEHDALESLVDRATVELDRRLDEWTLN